MYTEFTDREMASRHRCRPRSIQVIRTDVVPAKDTLRKHVQQFHVSYCGRPSFPPPLFCLPLFPNLFTLATRSPPPPRFLPQQNRSIRFPLPRRYIKQMFNTTFAYKRPSTFFG